MTSQNDQLIADHGGIFWTHIPKTSTSFGRTIFSWACPDYAARFAQVGTSHPPYLFSTCGRISNFTLALSSEKHYGWFHYPVFPNARSLAIVALFRSPEQRPRSPSAQPRRERLSGGSSSPDRT